MSDKITGTEVIELHRFKKRIGEYTGDLLEAQKQAVHRGVQKSIPMLVKASPVDTGLYAASWNFTVDEMGAIIGNDAPHAPIIEYGARPFTPPIGPLLAWAKRVLQDPSQPPDYSSRVWALAKATQNKIREKGMEPKMVLQKAMPKILENIRDELEKIV